MTVLRVLLKTPLSDYGCVMFDCGLIIHSIYLIHNILNVHKNY